MQLIKIYNDPPFKKVVWTATTYCNFNCSYCPADLHDNKYRWPDDYTTVIDFINKWRGNSPLMLDILGGEPTLWPNLSKFCKDLKDSSTHETKIIFSSNGSRSIRFWQEFEVLVDSLGLSFHPEEADVDHFLQVVSTLHERYPLTIWLMLSHPNLNIVKDVFEKLKLFKVKVRVMLVVEKLVQSHSGIIDNLPEYYEFAENKIDQALPPRGLRYRTYAADSNSVFPIQPQDLINRKLDAFENWNCFVGKDSIYIDQTGNVTGSSCSAGEVYGNIYKDKNINIPTTPIKCPYKFCGCGSDIEIEKYK
jgi:organic radical activating enzyme